MSTEKIDDRFLVQESAGWLVRFQGPGVCYTVVGAQRMVQADVVFGAGLHVADVTVVTDAAHWLDQG
jgi:hypothetical protein